MSNVVTTQSTQKPVEQAQTSAPVTVPVQPELVPLPQVLRQVQGDAAQDAGTYLDETAVPHGGE